MNGNRLVKVIPRLQLLINIGFEWVRCSIKAPKDHESIDWLGIPFLVNFLASQLLRSQLLLLLCLTKDHWFSRASWFVWQNIWVKGKLYPLQLSKNEDQPHNDKRSDYFVYKSCIASQKRDRVGVIIICTRMKFVYIKSPESIPSEDKQNLSYLGRKEWRRRTLR